jgi:toxin-antitoxin system PIN domain toxin
LSRKSLLDVNVLIALTEPGHAHHPKALEWFESSSRNSLGICSLTETGFLRVTTNPAFRPGPRSLEQAIAILQVLKDHPKYWYCAIGKGWVHLTARFAGRVLGHQQVTDACLLGLAIEEDGELVTFDRGLKYMAGSEFRRNLRILE